MSETVTYFVRIKPTSKRKKQVIEGRTYKATRGWYGPFGPEYEEHLKALAKVQEHDSSPDDKRVFEIKEKREAEEIAYEEEKVREPAGTIDDPSSPPVDPKKDAKDKAKDKDGDKAKKARVGAKDKTKADDKAKGEEKPKADGDK